MSSDPHSIPLDRLIELVAGLGIDTTRPQDIRSIHIENRKVEVVRFRRNESGRKYTVGPNEVATETVTIAIEGRA
jgi:hypothetical protein